MDWYARIKPIMSRDTHFTTNSFLTKHRQSNCIYKATKAYTSLIHCAIHSTRPPYLPNQKVGLQRSSYNDSHRTCLDRV